MAINMDALLSALPAAEYDIYKANATSEGAGTWHSLWKVAGIPAAGATPPAFGSGSGYVPTRAMTGALGQANPVGNRYLANVNLSASVVGSLIIYDRLWACSGFGTVVTTAQNVVTGGTLPAGRTPVGASDVELWLEVYTAPGATGATWTITAPDGGGTSRAYTYTHPANAESVGPATGCDRSYPRGQQLGALSDRFDTLHRSAGRSADRLGSNSCLWRCRKDRSPASFRCSCSTARSGWRTRAAGVR